MHYVRTRTFTWYGRHGRCEAGTLFGTVVETTEGLHCAYTQVLNNLHGRLAEGAAICSGTEVANTGWY